MMADATLHLLQPLALLVPLLLAALAAGAGRGSTKGGGA